MGRVGYGHIVIITLDPIVCPLFNSLFIPIYLTTVHSMYILYIMRTGYRHIVVILLSPIVIPQ